MTAGKSGRKDDPRVVYADIIDLPHWDSLVHPRMTMQERAAQFSPYAALVGYGDMVKEEARETGSRPEPGEDEMEELSRNIAEIGKLLARGIRPACAITYFIPDERKGGGKTVTVTETVRRIDPVRKRIVLTRKAGLSGMYEEIDMDNVIRITTEEKNPFPIAFPDVAW